jgi:hypothetical protein
VTYDKKITLLHRGTRCGYRLAAVEQDVLDDLGKHAMNSLNRNLGAKEVSMKDISSVSMARMNKGKADEHQPVLGRLVELGLIAGLFPKASTAASPGNVPRMLCAFQLLGNVTNLTRHEFLVLRARKSDGGEACSAPTDEEPI